MKQVARMIRRLAAVALASALFNGQWTHAASGTWNGSVDTLWTNSANWSDAPSPSGADTAAFTNAGSSRTTVDLAGLPNIKYITFDTAGAAAYTIGSGGPKSQTLVMGSNGLFQVTASAGNDQTVNASIQLGTDTATNSFTIRNDSALRMLTINGDVTGAPSGGLAGFKTLIFAGVGNTVVNGSLSKGGAAALTVTNALTTGTLTLSGSNTVRTLYMTGNAGNTIDIGAGELYLSNAGGNTLYCSQGGVINGTGKIRMSTSDTIGSTGFNYADCYVAAGKTLVINPEITGTGGFELWTATGTYVFNGINTFAAHVIFGAAGTISVSKIGNRGSATSNLGKGTTIRFGSTGKLLYTGAGETSDRILSFNTSGTLDQSGTGNLNFSTPPVFTAGAVTLTLQGSAAGTGELSGVVSNGSASASITKAGTGTWTLSAANRLAGNATVSGGTLRRAGANGGLAYATNFLVSASASLLLENSASANNGDRLRDASPVTLSGGTLAFSNDAGSASFSETAGALIITGNCTVAASQAAGGQTAALTFASLARNGAATLNFAGTGLGESDRNRIFIAGQPSGLMGTWATINGTALAAYDITRGVVPASETSDADIAARGPSVITNAPGAYVRINYDGVSGPITLSEVTAAIGTLVQNTGTDATVDTAAKTLQVDSIVIPAAKGAVTVGAAANDGTLTPATSGGSLLLANASAANLTVNANLADNGAAADLTAYGSGAVVLAGSNTFSGATTTTGGPLLLANTYALQNSTLMSAASFDDSVASHAFLLGGLSGAVSLVLEDDAASPNPVALATGNSGASTTLSGVLSGGGSLAKVGNGTLTLSGANTHSGGTAVRGGAVIASQVNALGTGPVTDDATLNLTAGAVAYTGLSTALSGTGTVNVTLGSSGNSTTLGGDYSGFTGIWNLGLNGTGGRAVMNGADSAAATINILSNGTLFCSAPTTHNAAVYLYGGNTAESYGQLRLEGNANWAGPVFLAGDITDGSDGYFGPSAGTGIVSGVISDVGGAHFVDKRGSAVLVFSGSNTYVGATWCRGGTLIVNSLKNLGEVSSLGAPTAATNNLIKLGSSSTAARLSYVGAGDTTDRTVDMAGATGAATLDQSGTGVLKFTNSLAVSGAGAKTLYLEGSTDGTGEFAGVITNGTGSAISLYKQGTGTWTLSGANSYSGGTSIGPQYSPNSGKLVLAHPKALGTGQVTFVNSVGTLEFANDGAGETPYNFTMGGGSGATLVSGVGTGSSGINHTLGDLALSLVTVNVVRASSVLSGTPSFTVTTLNLSAGGAGTTMLAPYDADLTVGSVSILSNPNPKTLRLDGTNLSSAITGCISNGPNASSVLSLLKDNTSVWTLFGSNSYGGATTVNNGTLAHYGQHTGGGATTVSGGTYALYGVHSGTGAVAVSGGTLLLAGSGGTLSSPGSLTLSANGTLMLHSTAASNNTDRLGNAVPVTLAGGTLRFSHTGGPANYSETAGGLAVASGSNTLAASQAESGNTSALTFAALSRTGGAVNFTGADLGLNDRNQILFTAAPALSGGIIGPWATADGSNFATYGAYGVTAYAGGFTELSAKGPSTIPDDASLNARISSEGTGGGIGLAGATLNSVNTLTQNTEFPATVSTASKTLLTAGLLINAGKAALTIGASAGDGTLAALTSGGELVLANSSANALTINAGLADNTAASSVSKIGSGPVVFNGACSYTGPTAINVGELLFASDYPQNLPGVISGNGTLVKSGTNLLQLLGANTYTGPTYVNAGLVRPDQNSAFGTTAAGTFIADGATLDVGCTPDVGGTRPQYGLNLGSELFTVQGKGVNELGAIINSATGGQYNAFASVALAGDTTFGAEARWDIRNGAFAMNDHRVTKLGANMLGLTSTTVTPGPLGQAAFDIKQGQVRLESNTKLNGSATNTVTVRSGAEFQLYSLAYAQAWRLILDDGAMLTAAQGSSGQNVWTGPVTLNGAAALNSGSGYYKTLSGDITGTGSLIKMGSGTTFITGTNNTFTGGTAITNGTLSIVSLRNVGEACSLGRPTDTDNGTIRFGRLTTGGTLSYTGTGDTTDRTLDLAGTTGGAAIYSQGAGLLKFTSDLTVSGGAGSKTLTLRGTKSGELAGNLSNGASSMISLTKNDANEWVLSGNNSYTGTTTVSYGTLTFSGNNACSGAMNVNSGTLIISGTNAQSGGNFVVGNQTSSNALARILPGARITGTGGFYIGNSANSSAAVYMTGGELYRNPSGTGSDSNFGLGLGTGSYGYFNMSDGTVTNKRCTLGGSTIVSAMGIARITGGTLKFSEYVLLGRTNGCVGVLTMDGGTMDRTGATQNFSLGHGGGRGELNLTGGSIDNTGRNVAIRQNGLNVSTGVVNLCAGSLTLNALQNTGGTAWLNFNGATLRAAAASSAFIPATMTRVTVNGPFGAYAGGAVIDTAGQSVTAAAPLQAPAGNGVATVTLASQGSGYVGEPYVSIDGGSGEGATAVANMEDDGTGQGTYRVASVTVTTPGWNFTSAPTVTFRSGGATNQAAAAGVALAANTSGGLTKLGSGTLTLGGANTYGGATTVSNGTLKLGQALALPTGTPVVLAGGTLDLGGFTVTNTVSGSGTVTNGTVCTEISPAGTNVIGTQSFALKAATLKGTYLADVAQDGTSDLVSVQGTLDLASLTLQLVDTSRLNPSHAYTLVSGTGARTGGFASTNLPDSRWHVLRGTDGTVKLIFVDGTLMLLK